MPIEQIELKLAKKKRERVHLVLDPRGFLKTVLVTEWFIGVDPAGGEDYTTVVRWLKDKILETYFLPKKFMEDLDTDRATSDRGLTPEYAVSAAVMVRKK